MIDVTAYIRELLFTHDCVILPSFGGFIANYRPAGIDNATNLFTPPVKAISFNRNLNQNDGLLISRISSDRGIGYADSKRLVEEYVVNIQARLKKGERVDIDLIGHFQNNSEGNPLFEPDRNSNFLLDSYGLTSFRREPVAGYDVTRQIMHKRDFASAPSITRKMVWRTAVAIPFIAAMVLVPLKTDLFRNNAGLNPLAKTEIEENSLPATGSNLEMEVDDFAPETQPADVVTATVSETVQATPDQPETVSTEGERAFFLVTGSFKTQENAMRQMKELDSKGFSAEINRAANGYYRVIATSFGTYAEADAARQAVVTEFPGTWILRK